jgi:hypothetical protein
VTGIVNSPQGWDDRSAIPDPYEAVGWTVDGQRERFEAIVAALEMMPGDSVLDFGCGLGAFADWVPEGVRYIGYDWSPGMVGRASQLHPDRVFRFTWPDCSVFDHVVCCGTFNIPGSKAETWQTLRKLWDLNAVERMAVSLYAGADPACLIYTVDEALEFGRREAWRCSVTHPRPNDVLLVMRRC